jgi:dynein intermediate chain
MTFGSHPGTSDSREGVVGTGTGQLFRFPMPFTGASVAASVEAHSGLVTAMHLHPSSSRVCRNLLLTASLDWTTKLWNMSSSSAPLLEFRTQTYDYVCDVAWSPTHPAVFATICTSGSLFLWNLSKSTSEPWESLSLRGGRGALNKLTWSRDGRLLLVGDCAGSVCVVTLSTPIVPEGGDEGRFELAVSGSASRQQNASSSASTTAPTDEDANNEDDDL